MPRMSQRRVAVASRTEEEAGDGDLSFMNRMAGIYTDELGPSGPPPSAVELARKNFAFEWRELVAATPFGGGGTARASFFALPATTAREDAIAALTLSNRAVARRERRRTQVDAPIAVLVPYKFLCLVLDVLFENRPIARFWFLENVARMPYFAYISMLHLYETLGWWRRSAEAKRVHFAQEVNEFHHLLVMENLGGDNRWSDRFFAQHSAVLYFWVLVGLWVLSPTTAYTFSELIEAHAVDTYSEFVDANRAELAAMDAPRIAVDYYAGEQFAALRDDMRTSERVRAYPCETLLDVFENIRDDEVEHASTAAACSDPDVVVSAPGQERNAAAALAALAAAARYFGADAVVTELDLDVGEMLGLSALLAQLQSLPELAPTFTDALEYAADALDLVRSVDAAAVADALHRLLPFLT